MKIPIFLLSLIVLIGCNNSKENTDSPTYLNVLEQGSYDVGFKILFTTDLSRESVPYSDWNGRLFPTELASKGRNLPLSIWYPAVKSKTPLKYGHFVNLIAQQSESRSSESIDSLSKQIFISQTNELGGAENFTEEHLNKLLSLQTKSFLNAKAIKGEFPLVIFPNGTSPAYQSIMCEFLASHGYIVAGFPLKGQYTHTLDASVKGLEVAVDDLEFALQQLLALNNVDGDKIALMANAIESSFCAALASRNKKIKALISLDGGFLSQFEQDILAKTNFYEPQNLNIPILALYAPHVAISPDHIFDLKYSDRYFAHFPNMTEFHFLNYGVFEAYVPGIIGETKENTKEGFKTATELTLAFLDAKLKAKTNALEMAYSKNSPNYNKKTIDTLFLLAGIKPPPNISIIKHLFLTKGMSSLDSIYHAHITQQNKHPFSQSFYTDFKDWLAWKKDPDFIYRKHLYEMAVESFPNSVLNNYYLAYYLNKTGNINAAKKYFSISKKLLETDNNIDIGLKNKLKKAIASFLA